MSPSNAVKSMPLSSVELHSCLLFHGGDTASTPVLDANILRTFAISTYKPAESLLCPGLIVICARAFPDEPPQPSRETIASLRKFLKRHGSEEMTTMGSARIVSQPATQASVMISARGTNEGVTNSKLQGLPSLGSYSAKTGDRRICPV